jgi:YD repeat-containing protein
VLHLAFSRAVEVELEQIANGGSQVTDIFVDNSQRLQVRYRYDSMGRETERVYGNGVKQETSYDRVGRVVLIRELDSGNRLIRAEGYRYDEAGRRTHRVDESGKITKYEYDNQSRLKTVFYPWTEEKSILDRHEAEQAGLYFTLDKGSGERYTFNGTEITALRNRLNRAGPARGNAIAASQMIWNGQTNDVLQSRIPESIRSGTDTSGPPSSSVPMFKEDFMSFGGAQSGGPQNANKGK